MISSSVALSLDFRNGLIYGFAELVNTIGKNTREPSNIYETKSIKIYERRKVFLVMRNGLRYLGRTK